MSLVSVGEDRSLVEYNLLDSNQVRSYLLANVSEFVEPSSSGPHPRFREN